MELFQRTATELQKMLACSQVTSEQIVQAFINRIEAEDSQMRAYLTITAKEALGAAQASDLRRKQGQPLSKWDGVPIAVKDNMSTKNVRTTCGSKMLEEYIPPYDATVIGRIKNAGMPILGKTNMDEFAMGSSTENSAFAKTHNPVNLQKVPGGSSGGSAAAVAGFEAPWSLGSDTGGSIRQPASFCGVVGLKPTYGLVSRYGLVAYASSLDQIGPIGHRVQDVAALLQLIAGHDYKDSTSVTVSVPDYQASLVADVSGLRIGIAKEFFSEGLNNQVKSAVMRAVQNLSQAGAEVVDVSLPLTDYAIETYYLIATAEASANLARYDGVRYGLRVAGDDSVAMFKHTRAEGFGTEVKRRIMLGTYALSAGYYDAYYKKAQQVRTLIRREFEQAFTQVDVIITPTTPTTAFGFGEKKDPLEMYLSDIYTVTPNLAGVPGLSMPCGVDSNNLPIGVQMIATHFSEPVLLRTAFALEQIQRKGEFNE